MNHGGSVHMGMFGVLWDPGGGLQEGVYKPIVVSISNFSGHKIYTKIFIMR